MGLPLVGPRGVEPNVIQTIDPQLFFENQKRYSFGSVRGSSVYPADPSYPSDGRSSCSALTPIYRGGQNGIFNIIDRRSDHGVTTSLSRTNGSWYAWDGVTTVSPFFPSSNSPAQDTTDMNNLFEWVFPSGLGTPQNRVMRGLKSLYETTVPFVDSSNPLVQEVEEWNRVVIQHFRNLLGVSQSIANRQENFISAKFAEERNKTSLWDIAYPGTCPSWTGPCYCTSDYHCGDGFVPTSSSHQLPYWNQYYCNTSLRPIPLSVDYATAGVGGLVIGQLNNGPTMMTLMSEIIWFMLKYNPADGHIRPFILKPEVGYFIQSTGDGMRIHWHGSEFAVPADTQLLGTL